jgi:glycosyltransferase involved in cell wall biosynthesis
MLGGGPGSREPKEGSRMWRGSRVGVGVPAYRAASSVGAVLRGLPAFVDHVVVVDDASDDATSAAVSEAAAGDARVVLVRHERNRGVGGATLTAFRRLLELGAERIVKLDADGQMDPARMEHLLEALADGHHGYAKGNRFHDGAALAAMPRSRLLGNVVLTFFTKAASGYWSVADPQNGYLAVRADVLRRLPLDEIASGWFFENDMLVHLNILRVPVADVPMPARYGAERSSLRIPRVLGTFPWLLFRRFWKRVWRKYLLYDSSPIALLLLGGVPLCLWGVVFGALMWARSIRTGVPATTGTVMLSVLPLVLGFQMLLHALILDVQETPK